MQGAGDSKRMRRPLGTVLLCLILGLGAGCGQRAGQPDVLLVTIDTARADHFSYTGASAVSTPNVDRLAAEGAGFLNAVAPTPITLPSHATLLTSLRPPRHGVRSNGTFRLTEEADTLAESFAATGRATAAFVGAAVLDRRYGLDQGFGHYDDRVEAEGTSGLFNYARRRGDRTVEAALAWLEDQPREQSTLVWVHLFDAHAPYEPPEPERSRHPHSAYAGSIAFADRLVGELLDGYRRLGRYEDAVIAVTADHGESLGEHGEATHGVFVYDATIRVPLVIRAPGVGPGRTVRELVSLADVMPTLLSLAGAAIPQAIDGVDLSPLLRGEPRQQDRAAYLESRLPLEQYGWSALSGVRTSRWKLITGVEPELYDLESDPRELRDLASEQEDRVGELRGLLRALAESGPDVAQEIDLDDATREQLESLGYLTLESRPQDELGSESRADPRERIGSKVLMGEAVRRYSLGDQDGGIAAARAVAVSEPENLTAWTQLGDLLLLTGRFEEAHTAFSHALELDTSHGGVTIKIATCLERLGREDEALAVYGSVAPSDPEHARARGTRWGLLQRLGRHEVASREAREALVEDRGDGAALLLLALERRELEGTEGVVGALEAALSEVPGDLALTVALATENARLGETEEAQALYGRVLAIMPTHLQAAAGLGRLLLARGDVAQALTVLERAAQTVHPDADFLLVLAQARTRSGLAETALPAAEHATRLRPDWSETWAVLGSVRLSLGRDAEAADAYRRAIEINPEDRISGLNLVMALERLGLSAEAREMRTRYAGPGSGG